MQWYLYVWKNYAVFDGRASRPEFWTFTLVNILIGILLLILSVVGLGLVSILYSLALVIPSLALQVRRLHDTNRSGWWILLGLIPSIGAIILLIFDLLPGNSGTNDFGAQPPITPN